MNFAEYQKQDRLLCILMALESAVGYSAPHPLLQSFLEQVGHRVSQADLLADIDWLAHQKLLTKSDQALLVIATLTQHGIDVALGRAVVVGVKRPMPGGV